MKVWSVYTLRGRRHLWSDIVCRCDSYEAAKEMLRHVYNDYTKIPVSECIKNGQSIIERHIREENFNNHIYTLSEVKNIKGEFKDNN